MQQSLLWSTTIAPTTNSSFISQMDSFTTIKPAHIPTNGEGDGTSGSGGYCVIFAKDTPTDKEGDGTSGSGGYCVVFNRDIPSDFEGDGTSGSGGYCTIA